MLTLEHLASLLEQDRAAAQIPIKEFSIGGRAFAFNATPAIMGVVNLSNDSWYRESVCITVEAAIQRGKVLQAQGADLVDLGAESTLAHAARQDAVGQQDKLVPAIKALSEAGVLVSAETYSPIVARACLEAGAGVLNLTGTENSAEVYRLAADHGAAVIICYVQGPNVRKEIETATSCGLEKLLIDPGLGFYYRNLEDGAVRIRHQMNVFLNTFRLRTLGFPICHALPHAFEYFREEVRSAEPFFAVLAALGKTNLFRTHEVPRIKAVLNTLQAF